MIRVGVTTEQLRRSTPGGIGRYTTALLHALRQRSDIKTVTIAGVLPTTITTQWWSRGGRIRRRADILHATSFSYPQMWPTVPTTVFVHDVLWRKVETDSLTGRGTAFHERALERVLRTGVGVFVPSTEVADALMTIGLPSSRITVTGEGSDHLPLVQRCVGDPYLLSVGTFERRKNLGRLLAAYELLRAHSTDVPPLRLVGSDTWRGAAGLPTELPVGVEIVGRVTDEELARLYAGATAFVYPSLGEGFGLPPLEAMRAGVPTICSAVPSVVSNVGTEAGERALIVNPESVDSIALALQRLLADELLATQIAANGQRWAGERTWAAVAERHVDVWKSSR